MGCARTGRLHSQDPASTVQRVVQRHASDKAAAQVTRTCFWMPSVMSTWVRMQLTHMLVGLGAMAVPHRQHSLRAGRRGGEGAALRQLAPAEAAARAGHWRASLAAVLQCLQRPWHPSNWRCLTAGSGRTWERSCAGAGAAAACSTSAANAASGGAIRVSSAPYTPAAAQTGCRALTHGPASGGARRSAPRRPERTWRAPWRPGLPAGRCQAGQLLLEGRWRLQARARLLAGCKRVN